MGTAIELKVGGASLDYAKNHLGNDWGFLFQIGDLTRRRSEAFDYTYYDENPESVGELEIGEETLVRPLVQVIPRLELLGYTLENARSEYQALVIEQAGYDTAFEDEGVGPRSYLPFEQFCEIANRYPLTEMSDRHVPYQTDDRDTLAQGRFVEIQDQLSRMPGSSQNLYWSEKSYFSDKICILTAPSMLQVLGLNPANGSAEVEWEFGPIVSAGWVEREDIKPGARREQTTLVATEGVSDTRILRKAFDALRQDVADFFRFIDGDERHHFWGAANLSRFAEGLYRIDIQNRVLILLDNDAEGTFAFQELEKIQMPENLRTMVLPDIDELIDFPALGPQGVTLCDINGCASSIECYLDLNLSPPNEARVVWSNYRKEIGKWQGALENKKIYSDHFLQSDLKKSSMEGYDCTKLSKLLDAIITNSAISPSYV